MAGHKGDIKNFSNRCALSSHVIDNSDYTTDFDRIRIRIRLDVETNYNMHQNFHVGLASAVVKSVLLYL